MRFISTVVVHAHSGSCRFSPFCLFLYSFWFVMLFTRFIFNLLWLSVSAFHGTMLWKLCSLIEGSKTFHKNSNILKFIFECSVSFICLKFHIWIYFADAVSFMVFYVKCPKEVWLAFIIVTSILLLVALGLLVHLLVFHIKLCKYCRHKVKTFCKRLE